MPKHRTLTGLVILSCSHFVQAQTIPTFLTLPFLDTSSVIKIQQGWLYNTACAPHDICFNGHPLHHPAGAFDFINGTVGPDTSDWKTFEVVAAADGVAMQSIEDGCRKDEVPAPGRVTCSDSVYGKFVLVRHTQTDSTGMNYFTLYAHLNSSSIDPAIPFKKDHASTDYATWLPVNRGQYLGLADTTGTKVLHLHFEVRLGKYRGKALDPYDISDTAAGKVYTRDAYPGGGAFAGCGPAALWTQCPPVPPLGIVITRAELDSKPWTCLTGGISTRCPLSTYLVGPYNVIGGSSVPLTATDLPAGQYTLSYTPTSLLGTLTFVTPSATQTILPLLGGGITSQAGGNLVFVINGVSSNVCTAAQTASVHDATGQDLASCAPPPLVASCACAPNPVSTGQATFCSSQISGGTLPYSYLWSTDGLAIGTLQMVSTAYSNTGSHTVNLLVTDAGLPTAQTSSCSVPVNQISSLTASCSISPNSVALGQTAVINALATGGTLPYQYQINNGALSATSSLSVVPHFAGIYSANVKVVDSQGQQATSVCTTQVNPASSFALVTLNGSKTVQPGQPVTFDLGIIPQNGFTGLLTWQVSGLPPSISVTNLNNQVNVAANGASFSVNLQTSTATPVTSYPLVLSASGQGITQTLQLTLGVTASPLSGACFISPNPIALGQGATVSAFALGGVQPYQFQMAAGLSFGTINTILVLPSSSGTFTYSSVTVKDSIGQTAPASCSAQVIPQPPLSAACTISPSPLHLGDIATVFASAVGGLGSYLYSINGFPYQNANSLLLGPQDVGTVTANVSVKDSLGTTVSSSCSSNVTGIQPTVTSASWDTTPHNRINFSGTVSGNAFPSSATVWFCVSGTTTCFQQPPAGVTWQNFFTIRVVNVNLTSGNWQVEVRTPYGSGRSSSFAVSP